MFDEIHLCAGPFLGPQGIATLDLNANASRPAEHQKVEFRTLVGGPEIRLIRLGRVSQLFDHEPFPRGAQFRMH
jgi:hypothetical protein